MSGVITLRELKDFRRLFTRGRKVEGTLFRLVFYPNGLQRARFVFISPRIAEKRAFLRNRARRRAREWLRKREELLGRPYDTAIIIKKGAFLAPRKLFYEELSSLFYNERKKIS